jgi:hypothetical protein
MFEGEENAPMVGVGFFITQVTMSVLFFSFYASGFRLSRE